MKKIYIIFFFIGGYCSAVLAQETKDSFQVLDSRNAFDERDNAVTRFQLLNPDRLVRVGEKGYCLLVHASGEMIELQGDTTVALQDLKLSNDGGTNEFEGRLPLEKLFSKHGDYVPDCHGCGGYWIFPPRWKKVVIGKDDDVCFRLKEREASGYVIRVISLFGDELGFYPIDATELVLDHEEFRKIAGAELKVGIEVVYNGKTVATFELWTNWNKPGKSFFRCDSSAFQSAMMGYYLENLQQFTDAERYFTLATQQSDQPVFREILEHYHSRSAPWLKANPRKQK